MLNERDGSVWLFRSLGRTRKEWQGIRRSSFCEIIEREIFVEYGSGSFFVLCFHSKQSSLREMLNFHALVEVKIRQEMQLKNETAALLSN